MKFPLHSPAAKAEMAKAVKAGTTSAKTSTAPAKKLKQAEKIAANIKAAKQRKSRLSAPGELARCRGVVSGDWRAAMLLYRIAHLWRTINPKMVRSGQEYLAMSRADWAMSAGLSEAELIKYALPRLRKYGSSFVTLQAMGNGAAKKLWANFDPKGYAEAQEDAGYELKVAAQNAPILKP
jgi:hypothetical protein